MKSKSLITVLSIIAIIVVIVVLVVVTSGKKKKFDNSNDPNANLEIRDARVNEIEIDVLESFPVQVQVTAYGDLPDGCTELHNVNREQIGDTFKVTIQTERPKDAICTQVLRSFEETFPLDVVGLTAGSYNVDVNGVRGVFTLSVDNDVDFDLGEK